MKIAIVRAAKWHSRHRRNVPPPQAPCGQPGETGDLDAYLCVYVDVYVFVENRIYIICMLHVYENIM